MFELHRQVLSPMANAERRGSLQFHAEILHFHHWAGYRQSLWPWQKLDDSHLALIYFQVRGVGDARCCAFCLCHFGRLFKGT
jgi:hypothetical protein